MADPNLELRDGNGALLISNDNWEDNPTSAEELRVHNFALQDPKESKIFVSLQPSEFTAILAGKSGAVASV